MTQSKKPLSRPKENRDQVLARIYDAGFATFIKSPVYLVGVRGYYANTFGKPFENDRVFFDDALFFISPNKFQSFNFNSDPSVFRKGVATLIANEVYTVVKHKHKGKYNALQIVKDKLTRDGVTGVDIGRHGINFHYDYEWYSRDSLGCQTIPRSQWADFIELVYGEMTRRKLSEIQYILLDN